MGETHPTLSCSFRSSSSALWITCLMMFCSVSLSACGFFPYSCRSCVLTDQPVCNLKVKTGRSLWNTMRLYFLQVFPAMGVTANRIWRVSSSDGKCVREVQSVEHGSRLSRMRYASYSDVPETGIKGSAACHFVLRTPYITPGSL